MVQAYGVSHMGIPWHSLTLRPRSFKDKGHKSSGPLIAAQKLDLWRCPTDKDVR